MKVVLGTLPLNTVDNFLGDDLGPWQDAPISRVKVGRSGGGGNRS